MIRTSGAKATGGRTSAAKVTLHRVRGETNGGREKGAMAIDDPARIKRCSHHASGVRLPPILAQVSVPAVIILRPPHPRSPLMAVLIRNGGSV